MLRRLTPQLRLCVRHARQVTLAPETLRLHYLDAPSERATPALLRQIGVQLSCTSAALPDATAFALTPELQSEHSSATAQTYEVARGSVWLDVRDSADFWVRCRLSAGHRVELQADVLRRFVLEDAADAVELLHPSTAPCKLVARFTRAQDAALQPSNDSFQARELVCELCRQYYSTEWMTGTGGAMSLRQGERVYVTPSGVAKERLQPTDLFVLGLDGSILGRPEVKPGQKAPKLSDCAPLFLHAHQLRDAAVVLHSHGLTCNLAAALCDGQSEFRISHQEMIKGLKGHGYSDTLVIPILDNESSESALAEPLKLVLQRYPAASAVLVRRHGLFVWGETWEAAKRHAECLHYLFEAAVEMRKLGLDYTQPPVSAVATGNPHKCPRGEDVAVVDATETPSLGEKHKVVLLDVEGTTTPISFVHDVLFPYVEAKVESYLRETWASEDTVVDVAALRAQHQEDKAAGLEPPALEATEDIEQLVTQLTQYVQWNVAADRKIGALKALQGHMWRQGYESGELKAQVYADVPPCLARLQMRGVRVGIYSSGSRQAQKLLFQFSDKGDLRQHLSVYFDTKVGHKRESDSYREILQSLGVDGGHDVLFVTDVIEEAQAAAAAGLDTVLSVRPGNKPLPESHPFPTITSFAQL